VRLLAEVRRRDARAREVMRSSGALDGLDARDRAFAARIVFGVVACRGALDEAIGASLARGHLEPRVRDALRAASFEILHLSTPTAAAVDQGVRLVREVAPRASGLANAVLRRVAGLRPEVDAAREMVAEGTADAAACARAAGLPLWLAEELAASRGDDALRGIAACQLEPAPVYVAANPFGGHAGDGIDALLEGAGLAHRGAELPGSAIVDDGGELARSGLVEDVTLVVADLSAQAVCRIAAPAPGRSLLEVGQGRATKTILIAAATSALGGEARIVSGDVDEAKVALARERLLRAGLPDVACVAIDARDLAAPDASLPGELRGTFDTVFVDAPCSGTGTMRRHPEIAWSLAPASVDPADAASLPALQLAILKAASARVAEGGTLSYSTCSVLRQEDEGVIEAFLASQEGRGFARASVADAPAVAALDAPARSQVLASVSAEGAFVSVPSLGGPDGHFCARLVRVG
jgi:16S rRNA (cytosine967-C5)-methyltransferase